MKALWQQISSMLFYLYEEPKDATIQTLSMMVLGLLLAGSVQLPLIASWVPADIQLTSIVRRFERFLSDPSVNIRQSPKGRRSALFFALCVSNAY